MNRHALVPCNVSILRNNDLVVKIAMRLNVPGAEELYTAEFERIMVDKEVLVVARLVASSGMALRIPATIDRFQQIPVKSNSPQLVFQ